MNRYIALIPLRGGSKGIPKKNIKIMAGKPLCAWVLEAATFSRVFDRVIVSTDSDEIANVVAGLNLGVEIMKRPDYLATDEATTEAVMLHMAKKVEFETMVTIQATSPLTVAKDLIRATEIFERQSLDSLLTGVRVKRFLWDPEGQPLNYDPWRRPRRQNFAGTIVENGAFYFTRKDILEKYRCRLGGKIGIYEMAEETLVEVDEPSDWYYVENVLKNRQLQFLQEKGSKIKLFAMDCDGVLTDGGMYYSDQGIEMKKFNTRDGMGIGLLKELGLITAIITGENSKAVEYRAKKLGIDEIYLGVQDKKLVVKELVKKHHLTPEEIAYIGDDINDMPVVGHVGLFFAVGDALSIVKDRADYVLKASGGNGAVREACEMLIEAKQQRDESI